MQNRFSLSDYLTRVTGENFRPELTLDALALISFKHLNHLRYQNTVLYNEGKKPVPERVVPDLDIDSLYRQLILENKPGYCFQNAELLNAVLTAVGFETNRHIACVINKPLAGLVHSEFHVTHELLTVKLHGVEYLIDTGFANNSLRGPIILEEGKQHLISDLYQLSKDDHKWRLDMMLSDGTWQCLYQFLAKPCTRDEIVEANKSLFLSPDRIPIRDDFFKAGDVSASKRRVVVFFNSGIGFYKTYRLDGTNKERSLQNIEEAKELACRKFNL